jgi:hypothetical protein
LGIAKAKQRASAPTWGWEQALMSQVLRSVALPGHLAVAWNEEMVFLDYGCEAVREALGQGKAVAVLIPGFALYDSRDPRQLLGTLAVRKLLRSGSARQELIAARKDDDSPPDVHTAYIRDPDANLIEIANYTSFPSFSSPGKT